MKKTLITILLVLLVLLPFNFSKALQWDISTATYIDVFDVSGQGTSPTGIFFNSDGTKMYVCDAGGKEVNQYALSPAWDVSTASYTTRIDVTGNILRGVSFSSDGLKMYVLDQNSVYVREYTLSTAWLVSSASYSTFRDISGSTSAPLGLTFKTDGTRMYIADASGKQIDQYNLSTAWLVSSASYSTTISVTAKSNDPSGIYFKSDGTEMYITDTDDQNLYQYSLSSAWAVNTASYTRTLDTSAKANIEQDLFISSDGVNLFIINSGDQKVNQYEMEYVEPDSCTYGGSGNYTVQEGDNCYYGDDLYINGSLDIIASTTGAFNCNSVISFDDINMRVDNDPVTINQGPNCKLINRD